MGRRESSTQRQERRIPGQLMKKGRIGRPEQALDHRAISSRARRSFQLVHMTITQSALEHNGIELRTLVNNDGVGQSLVPAHAVEEDCCNGGPTWRIEGDGE